VSTPSDISYTPFTPPVSQNSDHIDAGSYQEVDHEVDASMPISTAIAQQNIYQLLSTNETDSATFDFEKFLVDDLTTFEGHSPAPFTAPSTPVLESSTLDHPIAPRISSPMMDIFHDPSFNWQNSSSWSEKNDDSSTLFAEILSESISEDNEQLYSSQVTTLPPKKYTRYRQKYEDDLSKQYKDFEFRYGANHPATLDTGSRLVEVYIWQDRIRSAEALCKKIALAWLVTVGGNDVKTLQAFDYLALIFVYLGQYQLAESLCRQIYTKAQSCIAATDRVLLRFELSLAKCCYFNDAISEAEALYRKILRIGGQYLPPDDPLLINTIKSLSESLINRDELVESEKILRVIVQSIELSTRHQGELLLLQARADLGDVLSQKGAPGSGDLLRRVHQDQIELLGPEHNDTVQTEVLLANAFMRTGAFRESVSTLEDAVKKASRTLGDKHPSTIIYRQQLAQTLVIAKQLGYQPD
jgi:tetratricopeptide (TPR) repeat protein